MTVAEHIQGVHGSWETWETWDIMGFIFWSWEVMGKTSYVMGIMGFFSVQKIIFKQSNIGNQSFCGFTIENQ